MNEFIKETDIEKCLTYLAESVIAYKDAKALMKHLEYHRKSIRAQEVLRATGKTISENNTRGEASQPYMDVLERYKESVADFTMIEAYRKVAELKIEVWRTIAASNRRGNI